MKKLFSLPSGFVTTALLCAAVSAFYRMGVADAPLYIIFGCFVYGKLALAMIFVQGYGVKKGVKMVLGMPLGLAVFIAAISCIIGYLLWLTYQPSPLHPQTIVNLRVFGWSMASGVVTALCHWYFYARQEYFHEGEYGIWAEGFKRGDSPKAIGEVVAHRRSLGIIKPLP